MVLTLLRRKSNLAFECISIPFEPCRL